MEIGGVTHLPPNLPKVDHMTVRLATGDQAPDFALSTATGDSVTLASILGQRTILYFYPMAGTPGCAKQACDFRDNLGSLAAHGYRVIGVSPDSPEKLAKVAEQDGLTFPLLSDPERAVATAYGAYGEKNSYGRIVTGIIRSTFVIGADGKIEVAQYNVRATGHVAKLKRDLGLS